MQKNNQEPILSFEFASKNGEIHPLIFKKPQKVIIANRIEDVLPSFQLVEEAVKEGYYAAGFLTYESAAAFDKAYKVKVESDMPLLWFGIFSNPQKESLNSTGQYKLTKWEPNVSLEEYQAAISSIKQAIENGDTYQTNYTIRLHSEFNGDDVALFQKMKRAQASNYCAYINTGDYSVLSASPELFFHLDGDTITTRPMKGTVKRGRTIDEDEENANWLYHSEKNRAENVMIVDLLRNDLGRVAEAGTVQVPRLFEIEKYPTVLQMTSTITAEIEPSIQLVDIFKALFPCGSITGAPKISTMDIINKLETTPREVYCGAIGYITPQKEAIFNVPIRTVVINQQTGIATYGVGGGITWDSTTQGEYDEVLAKSSFLEEDRPEFKLLESLLLSHGEYFLKEEHLNRLEKTANYFGFPFHLKNIISIWDDFAKHRTKGDYKVRFLLAINGEMSIEGQPITKFKPSLEVTLANEPVDKDNPFLYSKTTNRKMYDKFKRGAPYFFDVLLWNKDDELTEFTNGNVVLEINGELWTPPVTCGLLAGTFRDALVKQGKIKERVLMKKDLDKCQKIWFINSVRKWVEVRLV